MTMQDKINLETVDPQGRVDVLAYRGAEQLARLAEAKWGLSGIWDAVKPHVHNAVVGNITGIEVPTEAKIILQLIQTNWGKILPHLQQGKEGENG